MERGTRTDTGMRNRYVLGAVLAAAVGCTAAIASALPPADTQLTRCKPGDSKIDGVCYASCGPNVVASNRKYCVSNCPRSIYQAGPNNKCNQCERVLRVVSVTPDCGTGKPCGNCDIAAGGVLYYCPLWGKTHWCCSFPPKDTPPKVNSKGARFGHWHTVGKPDYANGVAGPNVWERCASWESPLILRKTYPPLGDW
jgi:hypothetical protein